MKLETTNTDINLINQDETRSANYMFTQQQENFPSTLVNILPGIMIVLIIGTGAYFVSQLHPSIDSLLLAIIFGIFFRMFFRNVAIFLPGVSIAEKILLPLGIISYGIGLNVVNSMRLPGRTMLLILTGVMLFYGVMYLLNRWLKIPVNLSFLVTSGIAICGASAVAVLSTTTDSEPEDTSVSILVVAAVGLLGVMVFPLLKQILHLPDLVYAVLSGATLQQAGIIGVSLSSMSGEILNYAYVVMTVRIVLLLGVVIGTSFFWQRSKHQVHMLNLVKRMWFLVPFTFVLVLVSIFPGINAFLMNFKILGTIALATAVGSIGFKVDVERLLAVGSKPILLGLIGWIIVVGLILWVWPLLL